MFGSHLLTNLIVFLGGQAAAWFCLRTGRFLWGAIGTTALWLLLDAWLLTRYVFDGPDGLRTGALWGLQAVAVFLVVSLAIARWRRRWSAAAKQRTPRFAAGMASYLRSDYPAALAGFRQLVRTDPWDAAAWIALGDALRHSGQAGPARRCYRRAAAVDVRRQYRDLLDHLRSERPAG